MPRMAKCKVISRHYDKSVKAARKKNTEMIIPLDSAQRRERANLVEILEEYTAEEYKAMKSDELDAELGDDDEEVELVDEDEITEMVVTDDDEDVDEDDEDVTAEDLLVRRGESAWYDVEGHDENPVQGKDAALAIAKALLES